MKLNKLTALIFLSLSCILSSCQTSSPLSDLDDYDDKSLIKPPHYDLP